VVRQHQGVLVLLVAEVVEDPFLFHQPGDEIEIRLPVLHAVLAFLVGALEVQGIVGEAQVGEHLLDNLGNRLVLEDAAIGGPGEEPEPGDDLGVVAAVARLPAPGQKSAHEAVEIPGSAVRQAGGERDALAHNLLGRDGVLFREHLQAILEQAGHLLLAGEGHQRQDVVAQRGLHRDLAVLLRDGPHVQPRRNAEKKRGTKLLHVNETGPVRDDVLRASAQRPRDNAPQSSAETMIALVSPGPFQLDSRPDVQL